MLLGRWLKLPVMLTLRGKEDSQARSGVAGALKRGARRHRGNDLADIFYTVSRSGQSRDLTSFHQNGLADGRLPW